MSQEISQRTLRDYLLAKKKLEALSEKLKATEQELQAALNAGATVASGVLTAYMNTWERRDVAWKAVVERELGEGYATRVLAATTPSKHSELVVESV
jgi:hypothetical protein